MALTRGILGVKTVLFALRFEKKTLRLLHSELLYSMDCITKSIFTGWSVPSCTSFVDYSSVSRYRVSAVTFYVV